MLSLLSEMFPTVDISGGVLISLVVVSVNVIISVDVPISVVVDVIFSVCGVDTVIVGDGEVVLVVEVVVGDVSRATKRCSTY